MGCWRQKEKKLASIDAYKDWNNTPFSTVQDREMFLIYLISTANKPQARYPESHLDKGIDSSDLIIKCFEISPIPICNQGVCRICEYVQSHSFREKAEHLDTI